MYGRIIEIGLVAVVHLQKEAITITAIVIISLSSIRPNEAFYVRIIKNP